jgi:hypothetical protein
MRPIDLRLRSALANLVVTLAVAAAAILPVVLLGGVPGLIVGAVAVAVVGLGFARWLGLFEAADAAWLADAMGERLGGRLSRGVLHFARPEAKNAPGSENYG